MAGYDAALVNLVDARIRAHQSKGTATGTVVETSGAYAYVTMDGSALALPCKFVGGLDLRPDVRVLLDRRGSEWVVTGSFGKSYWPRYMYDQTIISGATNTAAALGSPEVGVTFVAPPSGGVMVSVGGYIGQATNTNSAHLSYSVRTGDSWSAGAVVLGFDYKRSIMAGKPVNTGAAHEEGSINTTPVTGLDAGQTYIVRAGHWTNPAGAITVHARFIMVTPI